MHQLSARPRQISSHARLLIRDRARLHSHARRCAHMQAAGLQRSRPRATGQHASRRRGTRGVYRTAPSATGGSRSRPSASQRTTTHSQARQVKPSMWASALSTTMTRSAKLWTSLERSTQNLPLPPAEEGAAPFSRSPRGACAPASSAAERCCSRLNLSGSSASALCLTANAARASSGRRGSTWPRARDRRPHRAPSPTSSRTSSKDTAPSLAEALSRAGRCSSPLETTFTFKGPS
mmetsp:Transcript_20919/g.45479  ORF Transcript_20919/g.45479 Transcript_20919/m.45479 type:complete len:236 (+) Transcript_20919:307-1014(+)